MTDTEPGSEIQGRDSIRVNARKNKAMESGHVGLIATVLAELVFVTMCIFVFPRQTESILLPGAFILLAAVIWQAARLPQR